MVTTNKDNSMIEKNSPVDRAIKKAMNCKTYDEVTKALTSPSNKGINMALVYPKKHNEKQSSPLNSLNICNC